MFFFSKNIYAKSQFTLPPSINESEIFIDSEEVIFEKERSNSEEKKFYIVVASKKNKTSARKIARKYLKLNYSTSVFKTNNGSYAISIGVFKKIIVKKEIKKLIDSNIISSSSYISTGNGFVEKIYPLSNKKERYVTVYNPPSNIRKKPYGDIICTKDKESKIKIYGNPILDRKGNSWFKTKECNEEGYIHSSQIRFSFKENILLSDKEIYNIKKSRKTKIYFGEWKKISVSVYIKWDSYSKNGGSLEGVVKSGGEIIRSFSGYNYSFRKIKIVLNTEEVINLNAKINKDLKIWVASGIKFHRKYK
jgi:hypothetical protein